MHVCMYVCYVIASCVQAGQCSVTNGSKKTKEEEKNKSKKAKWSKA